MKQSMMWKRTLSALGLLAVLSAFLFAFSVRPAAAAGIVVNSAADDSRPTTVTAPCARRSPPPTPTPRPARPPANAPPAAAPTPSPSPPTTPSPCGSQLPAVTTEMTITGNGAANTIIQANAAANTATYRVFEVTSTGNLTLDGVTVRHGRCAGACAAPANYGGGIYNSAAR